MATKAEIKSSLMTQNLVPDPGSWMKLAALIACVSSSKKKLDAAVYACYQKVK